MAVIAWCDARRHAGVKIEFRWLELVAEAGFTSAESNFATKRQFEYKWLATNFNSRLKAPWFHNETRANYGFT
jgi:hypothetical protein